MASSDTVNSMITFPKMCFESCTKYSFVVMVMFSFVAMQPSPGPVPGLVKPTPSSSIPSANCSIQATCAPIRTKTCLGQTLPYAMTNFDLATDSETEAEAQQKLLLWTGLQYVPRCWEAIQPLLCATYMPRCDNSTGIGLVELPARELCEITREPCKIVESVQPWPDFLQCNQSHFVKGCTNNIKNAMKFNVTGRCMRPLVPTNNTNSWYRDVEGCGIQCRNPLFTDDEHRLVHTVIAVFASLCLAATLFTILTFLIDWQNANRYPALILFFINICFCVGSAGWLAQFIPGARQDIVCRHDGTVRKAEPQIGSGETASCSVVFVLVYYSLMAGVTWFLILSYVWHLTFKALGSPGDAIEGKKGTFHLVAWSIPLVLTIVCLALTQVDGDSVSGICFVGYLNHEYRGGFVLLPIGLVVAGGLFFLGRGLVTLIKIKLQTPGLISDRASAKIRDTIIRIGIFAGLAFIFTIVTFLVHIYIFTYEPEWNKAFQDFVICETNNTVARSISNQTITPCTLRTRPSLVVMVIHILLFFCAGVTMSSWVWTGSTIDAWKRFLRRMFHLPSNEPVKLKKHMLIAQAFNKRQEIHRHGRFEFSFHSTHDDPLGMKMDLNSMTSNELSSAWAQAIPRMISRRGAFIHPATGTTRRYSDSDVQSIQSTCHQMTTETQQSQINDVEDLRKKLKKKIRRGKNRVAPIVTSTPPMSHVKPFISHGHSRRSARTAFHGSNSYRRGSITSDASDQGSLEHPDSSDAGSLRTNSERRGSLASVELPAVTAPHPQYTQVNTVQRQCSVFTISGATLPGIVPGTVEMHELVAEEPTFTSVTPLNTDLDFDSIPVLKRRMMGRRPSVGSNRSASSGAGIGSSRHGNGSHGNGSHGNRDIATRRFVVHRPKEAINATLVIDSDDCSEISV